MLEVFLFVTHLQCARRSRKGTGSPPSLPLSATHANQLVALFVLTGTCKTAQDFTGKELLQVRSVGGAMSSPSSSLANPGVSFFG